MTGPNPVEKMLIKTLEWIKDNRSGFLSTVAVIVALSAFLIFFFSRYHTLAMRASDKLSMAQGLLYQGQTDQGMQVLSEIILQYPRTAPAFRARMMKSSILSDQKKFAEAESTIRPVIERGKPKTIIPLAYPMLGVILENENNVQGAIALYEQFSAKYPGHFLMPKVLTSLTRLYAVSGKPDKAKATAEKIAAQFPGTPWAQRTQQYLGQASGPEPRR